ncbi:MAG: head-tail connector protein [Litorimonas sp.]
MTLTDLSPPPALAVSLDAAKAFLRVDHPDEDALITDLIDTATRQIEDRCGVSLITRPQRLTKSSVMTNDGAGIYLNRYPILSIDAVSQDEATLPLEANIKARPVFVCASARAQITVDFTAGYGETSADIPTPLRQGVMLLLAHLYEHRSGNIPPGFPMMVDALTQPYRGMRL